ncbi:MAG: hypothetical protein AMXMBFR36_26820 [Acidobacteriota bacterium]
MGDTAPLPLPPRADGATHDAAASRIGDWIERLIAVGVEPRCELLLAGAGVAEAALAAARLVGPRARVVAVAATEREAAELRGRAAASGAGQLEVVIGLDAAAALARPVPLALLLVDPTGGDAGSDAALARLEGALGRGVRALALEAPR